MKKEMMKFKFSLGDKDFFLEAEKCDTFWKKFRGLMFRKRAEPLVFIFSRPTKTSIHSFFVKQKFLVIWLLKGQVVDVKIVRPWTARVVAKQRFDRLLEIPFKSESEIQQFLVGSEKGL